MNYRYKNGHSWFEYDLTKLFDTSLCTQKVYYQYKSVCLEFK